VRLPLSRASIRPDVSVPNQPHATSLSTARRTRPRRGPLATHRARDVNASSRAPRAMRRRRRRTRRSRDGRTRRHCDARGGARHRFCTR
jgi:hypothetical protein